MDVHVTLGARGERTARIYRGLLEAILDGRLRPGERVPPTREFARRLDVSRNTVAAAYERLTAEGFLVGRVGSGTFVGTETVAGTSPGARLPTSSRSAPAGQGVVPRRIWQSLAEPSPAPAAAIAFDFRVGLPDAGLFPFQTWRRLVSNELRSSTLDTVYYGDPAGYAGLRTAIARHAGIARSVRANADDVIVTQGAQQALDLIGRVLIDPGTCVAMEDPGYPEARALFTSLGASVVGVPVDADGIDVAALPRGAKLIYVTPSHQFPLGMPMSLNRRAALLAWAQRNGAVIIEDDYDSEFRYSDRPLEPLQSIDRSGHVVYVGTFSKTLLPMLRLGFLVAPATLHDALRTAKRLTDWHGSQPLQAALARFIDSGELARHVRRAGRAYAGRHNQIAEALRRDFAEWLDVVPATAGLHLCARVRPDVRVDVDAALQRAALAGVAVTGLARYHVDTPARDGLVVGFGCAQPEHIEPGLRRLAAAFAA